MSIGIPVKLLHEAIGHTITVELKSGELYRGHLIDAEDNMNVQMITITMTGRDGRVSSLEQAFIRGSKIRFIIVPDMLKNAPMFKRIETGGATAIGRARGYSTGRGRASAIRARARGARGGMSRGR